MANMPGTEILNLELKQIDFLITFDLIFWGSVKFLDTVRLSPPLLFIPIWLFLFFLSVILHFSFIPAGATEQDFLDLSSGKPSKHLEASGRPTGRTSKDQGGVVIAGEALSLLCGCKRFFYQHSIQRD